MARTLLDYFGSPTTKPAQKEELKAQAPTPQAAPQTQEAAAVKTKKRERQPFPPIAPKNLPPSYFVSASYDGKEKKAVIKLYEPESGNIYFWYDNTGHLPYLLTNLSEYELGKLDRVVNHEGFDHFESEEKLDPLQSHQSRLQRPACHRRQTRRHHPRHHPRRLPQSPWLDRSSMKRNQDLGIKNQVLPILHLRPNFCPA
jgi:hypothetical protein